MTPAKRLFEEQDHVALYASSRPTLPHTLVQEIINYLNRKLFLIIYLDARSRPILTHTVLEAVFSCLCKFKKDFGFIH
jgi:hypothetical protein